MKLLTIKKRFIKSIAKYHQDPIAGLNKGQQFWKDSLKSIKRNFWKNGKFKTNCGYMIDFCHTTNYSEGVERR